MKINILEIIEKYNLSIRKIPNVVCEINDIRHLRPGDEIIETARGIKRCKRYKVPKNSGKYMVKEVNNNDSTVMWNSNIDNLADTLEESIKLFLAKKENNT
jgi:hypothetical protein